MASSRKNIQNDQDYIARKVNELKLLVNKVKDAKPSTNIYTSPAYIKDKKLPNQGFKIHISATFLNANEIFDLVVPYLLEQHIAFKVVASNTLLRLLNEDRFGYTQVGKFVTIYPDDIPHFVDLVHQLDKKLINFEAPIIPSDFRLHENSIVYYRYGVIANPENKLTLPNGSTVEDERKPQEPVPSWVENSLNNSSNLQQPISDKLLLDQYILLKVLRQRAKGLVALVLDIKNSIHSSPQILILKEARKLGALNEQGMDAIDRLEKEFLLMRKIEKLDICPEPIKFIKQGNSAFMIMKFWGKKSLTTALLDEESPSKATLIKICLDIANKLVKLHTRDIYFLDVSPDNILLNDDYNALLSDFEFALQGSDLYWFEGWETGTPGFSPIATLWRTIKAPLKQKLIYKDIFALGNIVLAIFNRAWYRNISNNKHPHVFNKNNDDIEPFLSRIPTIAQHICRKTNLYEQERYHSMDELIPDLQALYNHELQT